jgi:hypothetical protein
VPVLPVPRAALATALLVTVIELALLFVALSPRRFVVSRSSPPAGAERVAFILPAPTALPPARLRAAREHAAASATSAPVEAVVSRPPSVPIGPPDSASIAAASTAAAPAPASGQSAASDGNSTIGPVLAPRGFTPSSPLTRRVIDSVLDSLNAKMPALIWARIPTRAERDAAYKESVLAMRLSGRTLLVPADPHLAAGLSLPSVFSRRRQRESARVRTDSILAGNMERLARLRVRAQRDSLRRDSLQHVNAVRHADSVRAAMPRRRPDARTPA